MTFTDSTTGAIKGLVTLGQYSTSQAKSISMKCQSHTIKTIQLQGESSQGSCHGNVEIQTIAISYDSGLRQYFDFPEGTELTKTEVDVLPGTRCISGIAVSSKWNGEKKSTCSNAKNIKVSLTF